MAASFIVDSNIITLKQTHKENGSVTSTKSQEIPVSRNPQIPTPSSEPSAEIILKNTLVYKKSKGYLVLVFYFKCSLFVWLMLTFQNKEGLMYWMYWMSFKHFKINSMSHANLSLPNKNF